MIIERTDKIRAIKIQKVNKESREERKQNIHMLTSNKHETLNMCYCS